MCTGGELKQHSLFTLSIYLSCLQEGTWDDVSGETFLRTLLAMPVQEAKYSVVSLLIMVQSVSVGPASCVGVQTAVVQAICRGSPAQNRRHPQASERAGWLWYRGGTRCTTT